MLTKYQMKILKFAMEFAVDFGYKVDSTQYQIERRFEKK